MRRAVLDPGVLVSALISPGGRPARLVAEAREGSVELVISPRLLAELEGVLRREKFRRYIDLEGVADFVTLIRRIGRLVADPEEPPPRPSADPDDDYLIALAFTQSALLVSGDKHLLEVGGGAPILAPGDLPTGP